MNKKLWLLPTQLPLVSIISLAIVLFILLSLLAFKHLHANQPTIATVDMVQLMQEFVSREAKKGLAQDVVAADVKRFSERLKMVIDQFTIKEHVILFAKPAVISGCPDKTNQLRVLLL